MRTENLNRATNWIAVAAFALAALPFLWGAGYMSYRSLWFAHAAERAEGTVVEVTQGAPALTVEYRTKDGQALRTESGGSDYHKDIGKGDKLTVFYDPRNPKDARLDLWLENWLLPVLVGVPGIIILLVMFLVSSSFRSTRFTPPRLETGGTMVPAEFLRVRIGVNMDIETRAPGDFRLTEKDGRFELIHNGQKRDPYDPAVQRDLGLCYVVEAKGKDPATGAERVFESDPLDSNPERLVQGRTIAVYVDPKRPYVYRMELPFQKKAALKGQPSPITKL